MKQVKQPAQVVTRMSTPRCFYHIIFDSQHVTSIEVLLFEQKFHQIKRHRLELREK